MSSKEKLNNNWKIDSWRNFPIKQQPTYPDQKTLHEVEKRLSAATPLVHPSEIIALRQKLAEVTKGNAFLLQGGDCAESFAESTEENLRKYFRTILQMTVALMHGAGKPVVKVGRIAGQFAKPRSSDTETQGDITLPSYRGDMINSMNFEEHARIPDPDRLMQVYHQSSSTLNYLRALAKGGYASLENVSRWNQEFASESSQGRLFQDLVTRIQESLDFMRAFGLDTSEVEQIHEADFYTSHEGLLLNYEQGLTRFDPRTEKYYCCSAHMLWIGDRTRNPQEAHVEYLRGVANPVGVKVGPSTKTDELLELLDVLNPDNEPGRIVLITRLGSEDVGRLLPPIVEKVHKEGKQVVWSCDPMHGNTIKSPNGYKTRPFNQILSEVKQTFDIHKEIGSYAGGIHIEMTGQDVTECLGGAQAISEANLKDRYHTHCDPRLNASQSLELAFLISHELRAEK